MTKIKWYASIYFVTRNYGGPEEGGWWYDRATPSKEYDKYTKSFDKNEDSLVYLNELDKIVDELNIGKRELSSVLSNGRYSARVTRGKPTAYPKTRPHYE